MQIRRELSDELHIKHRGPQVGVPRLGGLPRLVVPELMKPEQVGLRVVDELRERGVCGSFADAVVLFHHRLEYPPGALQVPKTQEPVGGSVHRETEGLE